MPATDVRVGTDAASYCYLGEHWLFRSVFVEMSSDYAPTNYFVGTFWFLIPNVASAGYGFDCVSNPLPRLPVDCGGIGRTAILVLGSRIYSRASFDRYC